LIVLLQQQKETVLKMETQRLIIQGLDKKVGCWLSGISKTPVSASTEMRSRKAEVVLGGLLANLTRSRESLILLGTSADSLSCESVSKVGLVITRLAGILLIHGFNNFNVEQWTWFAERLIVCDLEDRMEEYLKWKLTSFFCWFESQVETPARPNFVPECDQGNLIVGGAFLRYANSAKRQMERNKRSELFSPGHLADHSLAMSLLMFKKSAPCVSDEFLKNTIRNSGQQLVELKVLPPDVHERDFWQDPAFPDHIDKKTCRTWIENPQFREGWGGCRCDQFNLTELRKQVTRTVREAYQQAEAMEMETAFSWPSERGHFGRFGGRMYGGAVLTVSKMLSGSRWIPVNDSRSRDRVWMDLPFRESAALGCDHGGMDRGWVEVLQISEHREVEHRIRAQLSDHRYEAELVGIKEPFKVRVISKGPAENYYLAKYLQRWMWRNLKRHRTFRLIGEPISGELLKKTLGRLGEGEVWVSGDYKSATDFLHPELSLAACRAIGELAELTDEYRVLLERCLTGHDIYRKEGREQIHLGHQRWGQLMGSPLSFPVLCLVNAAITRHVMEVSEGREIALHKARLLINGDDVGFPIQRCDYDMWSYATEKAGLIKSMGKNYTSTDFIMLNSMMYTYTELEEYDEETGLVDDDVEWGEVPFINGALLYGLQPKGSFDDGGKVGKIESAPYSANSLSARQADLLRHAGGAFSVELINKIFIRSHKEILENLPHGVDWVAPRDLGGLGLMLPGREPSLIAGKIARHLANMPEKIFELERGNLACSSTSSSYAKRARWEVLELERQGKAFKVQLKEGEKPLDETGFLWNALLTAREDGFTEAGIPKKLEDPELEEWKDWTKKFGRIFRQAQRRSLVPMSLEEMQNFKIPKFTYSIPDMHQPPVIDLANLSILPGLD